MTRTIVAICSTTGPGSGKSTYLRKVALSTVPTAHVLRFSDPLIRFLYGLCVNLKLVESSFDWFRVNEYEAMKTTQLLPGITGRDFMIAAGDAIRNKLRDSFYAEIMMKRINELPPDATVIIDDMRKMTEISKLLESDANLLIANVKHPKGGTNDCEFNEAYLVNLLKLNRPNLRLMNVTWKTCHTCGNGYDGFVVTSRGGTKPNQT